MNNTKLTPLGRLVGLIAALSVSGVVGAAGANAVRPHGSQWACVAVRGGDTVWSLAAERAAGDVRKVVHDIVEHNGLDGGAIFPGSAIWVPRDGGPVAEVDSALCPPVR